MPQQMMVMLKGEALGVDRWRPSVLATNGNAAASLWHVVR